MSGDPQQQQPSEPRPCIVCGAKALSGRRCPKCGAPVPARFVGVTIAEKYLVERLLGQGGMGSVYEALHLGLDEQVAIKFLSGPWAAFPEARERFRREVMALVRLRHPGIVSILDAGDHEGTPYMVMELLRGQALGTILAGGKKVLSLARAAAVFDQIFEVLDAAHRVGVVHRDLKPDNVFLIDGPDRTDRVKLLDFGIAKLQIEGNDAGLTRPGTVEGTPYYMSPEQCRGQAVGPATDVYAAGVMLFEALTGELPFMAPSITEIMAQHLYVPAPKLAERGIKPTLPAGVEALVQSILAKEPAARPSSAQARENLAAAARGADAASNQASAAAERQRVAVLSRSQRALTLPKVEAAQGPAPGSVRALIWHHDASRASLVAGALGAGGLSAVTCTGDAPQAPDGPPVRVVLLPSGGRTTEQLRALRQHPTLRSVPVLIFDIARADEVPAHIRAGASDAALAAAGDAELAPKALRLARRGR